MGSLGSLPDSARRLPAWRNFGLKSRSKTGNYPDDGVDVGVAVADEVAGLGQGELPGSSFLCASGALHVTVTVLGGDGAGDGLTVVVGPRLMTHVPEPQGNFISDPDCTTIVLAFVVGTNVPLIWSDCPNATAPNMHPATSAYSKILVFMLPLNPQTQCEFKFLVGGSLAKMISTAQ